MYYAFLIGFSFISGVLLAMMGLKIMQILQLSSYRAGGVVSWLQETKWNYVLRYFSAAFFSFVSMLVYVGGFGKYRYVSYIGLLFYLLFTGLFVCITLRQKSKTPLKFTPRIIRLTVLTALLFALASFGILYAERFVPVRYAFLGLMPLAVPLIVIAAHWILLPLELLNNFGYEHRAHKKLLDAHGLIKIGITGSYGKTTAKNILAAMLAQKYEVLSTPSSYNTPLGIARTVNYNLTPDHRVFLAEMGARYRGDIAKLAKLVCPDIGVITAVGNQHLATFGSVETIAQTKYELIQGLSSAGVAVFSADNPHTIRMYEQTACKKILAGNSLTDGATVTYANVTFGADGTGFDLQSDGQSEHIVTKLLGRHIPSLVSLCAAVALQLDVSLSEIAQAVARLEPVEHRLQLIQNGDVTVLDDAYNSNVAGAKNALEVLKAFDGTRVIVTPGLVELGDEEENANFALGECVYGSADFACFVGGRAQVLKEGALSAGMSEENIFVCETLDEAVAKTGEIAGKKTILFENDLPDNIK